MLQMTDTGFNIDAYFWLCIWYVLFTVDTVYGAYVRCISPPACINAFASVHGL